MGFGHARARDEIRRLGLANNKSIGTKRVWAILPLLVVVMGLVVVLILMETGPQAQRKERPRNARLVDVEVVRRSDQPIVVDAMGTVVPSRVVDLKPRVSGEIMAIADEFVPGGRFLAGETLVRIDPTDYALLVRQRKSDVAKTQSAYQLETAQTSVAEREFELLGETIAEDERDLVLRKPQLESARAAYEAAEAVLEDARLDQERTRVTAPFNGVLQNRQVNVGTQVTPTTSLGTLVGTDEYWIDVSVPVDQLQWLQIPGSKRGVGSMVRIYNEAAWGREVFRTGHVIRLAPAVEAEGRMARLLVAVDDPLGTEESVKSLPSMLLGTYVRVEITGIALDQALVVRRTSLHDGDIIWIMNEADQLEIRPARVVFRGRDEVLVEQTVRLGERVVTTDLGAPVAGMPLRVNEEVVQEDVKEGAIQ
jgi:RND family efflux transporter MFP subunit